MEPSKYNKKTGAPEDHQVLLRILIATVVLYGLVRFVSVALMQFIPEPLPAGSALSLEKIIQGILFVPVVGFLLLRHRKMALRENLIKVEVGVFLLGFLDLWLVNMVPSLAATILGSTGPFSVEASQTRISFDGNPVLLILGLGVLGPMLEELLCRGVLFQTLRQYGGFLLAAAGSSLVFALFHGIGLITIITFFGGILFCLIYERTGNFGAPVALHMANNLLSILFHTASPNQSFGNGNLWIPLLLCSVALVASIWGILRLTRNPADSTD